MGNKTNSLATKAIAAAIIGLCLMPTERAIAAALVTSPLTIQTANSGFRGFNCLVTNAGSVARSGTVEIHNGLNVLSAVSYNGLAPGDVSGTSAEFFSTGTPIILAFCKITVDPVSGEKDSVAASAIRGSLLVLDPNGNTVANAEAR